MFLYSLDLIFWLFLHLPLRNMYLVEFSSVYSAVWKNGISTIKSGNLVEQNLFEFSNYKSLSKLQWLRMESAFKNASKFGFVTSDKILRGGKKKKTTMLYTYLSLWNQWDLEQTYIWRAMLVLHGKLLGAFTTLENCVTSISVQNSVMTKAVIVYTDLVLGFVCLRLCRPG